MIVCCLLFSLRLTPEKLLAPSYTKPSCGYNQKWRFSQHWHPVGLYFRYTGQTTARGRKCRGGTLENGAAMW